MRRMRAHVAVDRYLKHQESRREKFIREHGPAVRDHPRKRYPLKWAQRFMVEQDFILGCY